MIPAVLAPSAAYAPSASRPDTNVTSADRELSAQSPSDRSTSSTTATEKAAVSGTDLDQSELKVLQSLKARDREVRAHEAAHQSAGGQYAGAASFTYERGPDGVQYAVGGEVPIMLNAIKGNPAATINKMRTVQSAALAPAQPSGQDRAVAGQAMQIMLQAQAELALQAESSRGASGGEGKSQSSATVRQSNEGQEQYRAVARIESGSGSAGDRDLAGKLLAIA